MVLYSFRDKDLALHREVRCSLQAIFGIGYARACWLANKFGLSSPFPSSLLNSYYISLILGFLNFLLRSETKIRRDMELQVRLLKDLGH